MPPQSARAPKVAFIFFTLLLNVLGFGLLIPVSPRLVEHFLGLPEQGAEGRAAWAVSALAATYALMQFIFAPILGSLSDRFGRRPVILVSLLGSGVDYFVAAAAFIWWPSLWLLFITRAISGISGASIAACNAYIADITPPEKRAGAYGLLGAAFGLGFMLGPLAGGLLGDPKVHIPLIGPGALHYPFIAAGLLSLANWLYGYFVLPESLAREHRRAFSWSGAGGVGGASPMGALAWLARRRVVAALAGALFLLNMAQFGLHVTWVLSFKARFGWSPAQVGWSLFVVGLGAVIVQGFLARRLVKLLGERACLVGGVAIGALAFAGYALASQGWMVYAIIAVGSLGGVWSVALQSITTRAIAPSEQGLLQGALASLASIAMIIGAALAGWVFGLFTRPGAPVDFPGAPFASGAALCLLALVPVLMVWGRMPGGAGERPEVGRAGPEEASPPRH